MAYARIQHRGFTLVEVLVVMGLSAILFGLASINLIKPQTTATLAGTTNTLVTDLRSQQIKAMSGDSISASSAQAHGIYVQSNQYTLFKGTSYSAGDTDNFVVTLDAGVTLSSTLASGRVVFTKATGAFTGFSGSANTITVTAGGSSKVITLNRYGSVSIN
jgi:prepilin-type N-terminal cleavage/methylation domain-containing protein